MNSYFKSKSMYITLGITAISVVAYIAVMDVFDFKNRGEQDDNCKDDCC